ncbi:ER membrane protein complex subunit 10 [Mortierella claussenii]|nr:ER membrane protein complex subunit 10 [Mortierella claussenii]
MRLNTYILALTLVASVQVLAEEVTLGVWHKLSDHESFEKRGEIRFDADEWLSLRQQREQAAASSTQTSKQRYQKQQQQHHHHQSQQQSPIVYQNIQLDSTAAANLVEDFILNERAPIKYYEMEPEPQGPEVNDDGEQETEEEFEQRLTEWRMQRDEFEAEDQSLKTPGSYGFYQIKLRDESRGWEAISSIKSCLLVASDFQEEITLHLDNDRNVFAFDYYTTASKCEDNHKKVFPLTSLDHFKSVNVDLATGHTGPKPRYARAQAIKIDTQTGKPETEKTFFQKYWVYIVPIVLVMLFTGGEPEKTAA